MGETLGALEEAREEAAVDRVGGGVVGEETSRDLALDAADVAEALAAHQRVRAVALLLHGRQRGLHQHALALGEVARRHQTLAVRHATHRHRRTKGGGCERASVIRALESSEGVARSAASCVSRTLSDAEEDDMTRGDRAAHERVRSCRREGVKANASMADAFIFSLDTAGRRRTPEREFS